VRLNRYLAASGLASRRGAEALIEAGRVQVNGKTVETLAVFVEPGRDTVTVDGRPVRPPLQFTYYVVHKPVGVVTTVRDPEGRPTVMGLIPKQPRVFPVGRLDQDTSGILILTDDGDLTHHLLHPRYHVEKEYDVVIEGILDPAAAERLRRGLELPDDPRPTAPAGVEGVIPEGERTRMRIVLREGRNRQVRRMLEVVGHPVIQLRRVRFGPVELGGLPVGRFRLLTAGELSALRRAVAGSPDRPPGEGG
jgi:23S rRNA pseudouridine2605 synthase